MCQGVVLFFVLWSKTVRLCRDRIVSFIEDIITRFQYRLRADNIWVSSVSHGFLSMDVILSDAARSRWYKIDSISTIKKSRKSISIAKQVYTISSLAWRSLHITFLLIKHPVLLNTFPVEIHRDNSLNP